MTPFGNMVIILKKAAKCIFDYVLNGLASLSDKFNALYSWLWCEISMLALGFLNRAVVKAL